MATQATAVWRLRVGGNAANGAGYDPGISGAGTNYSTQDSPQLSLADIACSNTTTVTSATGGFTAAMIGNAIKISGGGATTGYYWITARASSTSITVDRTPGTVSGGTGKVGGACRLPSTLGTAVVAGNTVYILGSAGNASSYPTSSLDYTETGFFTPTSGDTTNGWVRWAADPAGPMPTLASNGLYFYAMDRNRFEGLYLTASSNSNASLGIIKGGQVGVVGCVLNLANQAGLIGIVAGGGGLIVGTEVYGGTASPTSSSGSYGISPGTYNTTIEGCDIHHCRDDGINMAGGGFATGTRVLSCLIRANAGNGIATADTSATIPSRFAGNTIDGNAGHGIAITGTAGICSVSAMNNIISNHTGAGKYGISVSDGSTAANDRRKNLCDYNNLFNNTSNYNNISAGAHDLSVDPQYVNAAGGDFTPGNSALQAGFP